MTGDCCVLKFLRRSVDGKHLMCFQISPVWCGRPWPKYVTHLMQESAPLQVMKDNFDEVKATF